MYKGQIRDEYPRRSVRRPTRGHISESKQDRATVTMEYYTKLVTSDSAAAFKSSSDAPGEIL